MGRFAGGLFVRAADTELLLGLLCRMPKGTSRDALLARISESHRERATQASEMRAVILEDRAEEPHLALVTQAASRKQTLVVYYFSAARGVLEWRHLSVQRVFAGTPARLVAHCHRSSTLKWFRVDGIVDARIDAAVRYARTATPTIDEFLRTSVDGFNTPGETVEHRFFVSDPDARWVERNLISGTSAERMEGGVRVTCRTHSPLRIARFVLSLAPIARAETRELGNLVAQLAEATAAAHGRAKPLRSEEPSAIAAAAGTRRARRAPPRRRSTARGST
jgi:predicted DNA-binding transcriptional regulator YafY